VLKLLSVNNGIPCFSSANITVTPESLKFNSNYVHNWATHKPTWRPSMLTVTDSNARVYNQLYQFCNQPLKLGSYEVTFNEKIKD